ncbi:hypothetical protein BV898_19686 [Hypsibius exemplaris]|uniref:Uncharacterized protein n=1 Tax=Hypsibius exemplaris TaxID=2072580 RepID=A0A9X6NLX7_HYPEX|nr:hypothetical protein BV898_19686 [Hypsibius exemplaris]
MILTAGIDTTVMAAEIIQPATVIAARKGTTPRVNPSWNSTLLFPGTLISEGEKARFPPRKVQRLLPAGFTSQATTDICVIPHEPSRV